MSQKRLGTKFQALAMRLVFAVAVGACSLSAQGTADLILQNGKILTVDKNFSVAQALSVSGNQIAAVGTNADVMKLAGPNTQVINLKGRTVIPGLMDTHLHYTGWDYGGTVPEPDKADYR